MKLFLFLIVSLTISALCLSKDDNSLLGTYHSITTHTWGLEIKEGNQFEMLVWDAGGPEEWTGIWKREKNEVYLLIEENGILEVFWIITNQNKNEINLMRPEFDVADESKDFADFQSKIGDLSIYRIEMKMYKKI